MKTRSRLRWPNTMHAAASLDPRRYAQPSQQLTDKLITLHFGCWGVWRAARGLNNKP
jgi:hypothetical protein